MQRLWFVTNPGSGSATLEKAEALAAIFHERGLELVGRTGFPQEDLPDPSALEKAGVDTVVLFAGDGTINATLSRLRNWSGAYLILPGGTMNLLAKALHDTLDPAEIVHRAHSADRRRGMPFIRVGDHRAFVGLIIGPAANWFRPREAVRARRFRWLIGAARFAWRRTFGRGVRVAGAPGLRKGYQAIFVHPGHPMTVAGIDARDWRSIAELGWNWLTGEWVAASAVSQSRAHSLRIVGAHQALALVDGEPITLTPEMPIESGESSPCFLTTKEEKTA